MSVIHIECSRLNINYLVQNIAIGNKSFVICNMINGKLLLIIGCAFFGGIKYYVLNILARGGAVG
jgi:hypothetical protein